MRLVLRCFALFLSLIARSKFVDAECGNPGTPFGGHVALSDKTIFENRDTVYYWCGWTDYLLGNPNRTCGPDGKWTGSVPACIRSAPPLGNLVSTDSNTGSQHDVIAEQHSRFFDQNSLTCCDPINHGGLSIGINFVTALYLEGVRVVFRTHNEKPKFRVYTAHNESTFNSTLCVESGSNSFRHGEGYQVNFGCTSKHGAVEWLYIIFDATQEPLSICEIMLFVQPDDKICDTPDQPVNGKFRQKKTSGGKSFASFYCDPGFELIGSEYTFCSPKRTWTHDTPKCIKSGPENYSILEKEKNHQILFEFRLNHLYMGIGSLALLLIITAVIVLIKKRVDKDRNARNAPYYAWSGQDTTSIPTVPSHIDVQFPLPRDVDSKNYYSVAFIPDENNQYMTIVEDPIVPPCQVGDTRFKHLG